MKTTITLLLVLACAAGAQAGIQWTWVNAGTGTEQGTLVTDGELVGGLAPAGSYTVVDFSVTATAYALPLGSCSGGEFAIGQPEIGFDWDGSAPTVFWRSNGSYTNGFAFSVPNAVAPDPDRMAFSMGWFVVDRYYETTYLEEEATVVLTPAASVTSNEARTFGAVKRLYR